MHGFVLYKLSGSLNFSVIGRITQAAQAQYECTCGYVIFKMAFIIKGLHGNSGNRFEKVNTRMNFQ